MLAEVLVEGLRWHGWERSERTFVVVVAVLVDFRIGREGFWFLVDVCLLGAEMSAELNVVDVAGLVEEGEETFAFGRVVLFADTRYGVGSQHVSMGFDRSVLALCGRRNVPTGLSATTSRSLR